MKKKIDNDWKWASDFSEQMTEFGNRMAKLGEKMADSSNIAFQNCFIQDDTQMVTMNGKTTIKKGNTKIVIDKDGNVIVNGKKVENEEEKKHGDLEKLVDIPKIDDPNLFRNIVPTKAYVHENLTTPLTLAHLDKYELKLTNLESKLGGRIEKLLIAVAVIAMMSLTTLFLLCMNS